MKENKLNFQLSYNKIILSSLIILTVCLTLVFSNFGTYKASADTVDLSGVTFDTGVWQYSATTSSTSGSVIARAQLYSDFVSNTDFPVNYIGTLSNSTNSYGISSPFTIKLNKNPNSSLQKNWSLRIRGVEGFDSLYFEDPFWARTLPVDLTGEFFVLFHNVSVLYDFDNDVSLNKVLSLSPSNLQYGYGTLYDLLGTDTFTVQEIYDNYYSYPQMTGLHYFRRYVWYYDIDGSQLSIPVSVIFAYPLEQSFSEGEYFLTYFYHSGFSVTYFNTSFANFETVNLSQYYVDLDIAYETGYTAGETQGYSDGINAQYVSPYRVVVETINNLLLLQIFPGVPISIMFSVAFGTILIFVVIRLAKS